MNELEKIVNEWSDALEAKDWNRASAAINSMWLLFHVMITPITNPELKELNYFKVPVTMDNGGKYLLSFTHVDGPKIKFDEQNQASVPFKRDNLLDEDKELSTEELIAQGVCPCGSSDKECQKACSITGCPMA